MKPIIVKISKNKFGSDFITMTQQEFEAAIDCAYEAGIMDGRRLMGDPLGYGPLPDDIKEKENENARID